MKKDILDFIARYLNYQPVKFEHQRPGGVMQWLPILERN